VTHNLISRRRVTTEVKEQVEGSVEARALARAMADGADGSAAAERLWREFMSDLNAAVTAEIEESHNLWFATPPDQRQFLLSVREPGNYGPCSVAQRELFEALTGDRVALEQSIETGVFRPGHAIKDWFDKHLPVDETDSEEGAK
jgi:hypothetical protein